MKGKKVLVLSPHADDAEIGCGGSIAKYREKGYEVQIILISRPQPESGYSSYEEFLNSMKKLDVRNHMCFDFPIRKLIEKQTDLTDNIYAAIKVFNPDIIFMPSLRSSHDDHAAVAKACFRATRRANVAVLGYHILGDSNEFTPTLFEILTEKQRNKKLDAIRCYKSQYKERSNFFTDINFDAQLRYYASMVGKEFVEAFEVIRWVNQ